MRARGPLFVKDGTLYAEISRLLYVLFSDRRAVPFYQYIASSAFNKYVETKWTRFFLYLLITSVWAKYRGEARQQTQTSKEPLDGAYLNLFKKVNRRVSECKTVHTLHTHLMIYLKFLMVI